MTTLQRSLDDTARRLSVHAPIVAMPGLHKLTLALGFWLDHRYNLGTSLHQFKIVQHTSAARKMLKDRANQHKVVAGSGAAPFLSGAATLTAKDRVSLLATLSMAWGDHVRLRVFLFTLFIPYHSTTLTRRDVNTEIMERDIQLDEYNPRGRGLKLRLPASITCWVQIRLSDCFSRQ